MLIAMLHSISRTRYFQQLMYALISALIRRYSQGGQGASQQGLQKFLSITDNYVTRMKIL